MTKDDYVELKSELYNLRISILQFSPTFTISKIIKDDFMESINAELEQIEEFIKRM